MTDRQTIASQLSTLNSRLSTLPFRLAPLLLLMALPGCGEPASGSLPSAAEVDAAAAAASTETPRPLPAWATPPPTEAVLLADSAAPVVAGPGLREVGWEALPAGTAEVLLRDSPSLVAALDHQLRHLASSSREERSFGGGRIARARLVATLLEVRRAVLEEPDGAALSKRLARDFRLFQSRGKTGADDVLFTGYFLPVYEASAVRTDEFSVPLYARPAERDRRRRIADHRAVDQGALKGRGLEVAWLRSKLDRFFLMVQGSGILVYPDGTRRSARYAGGNGHQYTAIGRLLVEDGHIPREEISMQRIRQFFSRRPELEDAYLHRNRSFVFFRIDDTPPLGLGAIPLTPDVSVATDPRVFGTGLLGLAAYDRPYAAPAAGPAPTRPHIHPVIAQDAGGAIKGPGHIDIFTGTGDTAGIPAGFLNHTGGLWFLVNR